MYIFFRIFKIPIFMVMFSLFYILLYIFYIQEVKAVYISPSSELSVYNQYAFLAYWKKTAPKNPTPKRTIYRGEKFHFEKDIYSSVNQDFILDIPKIGIHEKMFVFSSVSQIDEYKEIDSKKTDKDLIDFELNNLLDLSEGFFIGGHSSGNYWDNSPIKSIFKSLDFLEVWDLVNIVNTRWDLIAFRVKSKNVFNLDQKLDTTKSFYLYTCYPTGSTKQRLVLQLEIIEL